MRKKRVTTGSRPRTRARVLETRSGQPARADLPFLLVNMAMTADGKIATGNRKVSSFGSSRDQEHLLELRATADAVMAGARTVDLNPVHLGPGPARYRDLRRRNGLADYNLRIVVSRTGSLNPSAAIFSHRFSPVIVLTTGQAPARRLRALRDAGAEVRICGAREIDFPKTFAWLRATWHVRRLLCEGGGELNDALFRANLVDELHLTICPKIFGGSHAPTIVTGRGYKDLASAFRLVLKSSRRVGNELFLVYSAAKSATEKPGS